MNSDSFDLEEEAVLNAAVSHYLQHCVKEMIEEIGEEGKQESSKCDSMMEALISDYESAVETLSKLSDGTVLGRMNRIIIKEALNCYAKHLVVEQLRVEEQNMREDGQAERNDKREHFIDTMYVVDRLLERILKNLEEEPFYFTVNGKRMVFNEKRGEIKEVE